MKDFFISYNKADSAWAEWIAWVLEEAGHSVVIQAWDFRPGSNFVLEMNEGLKEADRVVAVLSPDYIASRFTAPEWAAAFARDSTGEDRKLVSVRVREADLFGLLGQVVHIDFVGVHDEAATRELLLQGVQKGRAKPTQKPVFPGTPQRTIKEQPRFPGSGSLPPVWNVPHNRNRNFTGRVELLATLRSQLQAGHHSALTALHGLGGIGKTQVAVEYAYRYGGEYDLVWWLRSEDPATLAGDYALLAEKLGLPETEADQQAATQAAKNWLATNRGWLLVFDNAEGPEGIRPYLPSGNSGHVIITSRRPDWRSVAHPLSVSTLSPEDAVEFLHIRSGQQEEPPSRELVEELGWLPLAIEQAAAYIDEHGRTISEYLNLFRQHRQAILGRGRPSPDYPASVATTWELSFAKVREQSPAAADLLSLCAFLAPDDIPIAIIRDGKNLLPEPLASAAGDDLEFDEAISALRRHSLVERTGNALSVHRLVQVVVRDRMAMSDRQLWAESAAGVVRLAFPYESDDVRTWPVCARLFAHATSVAAHCEAEEAGPELAAGLLSLSALYLYARADLYGAKALDEWALKIDEASFGPDHPNVAIRVNNLGSVLHELGELVEAQKHFERALKIDEASFGPDHPNVARDVNNLGIVLQELGELAEARKHYERALKIDEASFGPDHPKVAIRVNNLGSILKALGELTEARKHFERALKIDEASYGPDHPNVARDVNNLGGLLKDRGEMVEARKHTERALKIFEASYGPDHQHTQLVRKNLLTLDPPAE
ncbi:MAG: FxSxx-COOH system tetratricopeptide repeat protein [Longimicrobiaceae bacterium]